jgi:hypothetical protein
MSIFLTKPISGIKIDGADVDLRTRSSFAGTFEPQPEINFEVLIEETPENINDKAISIKGKNISGRVWADPEQKASTKHTRHKPGKEEEEYRKNKIKVLSDFSKARKAELQRKVTIGLM